VEFFVFLLLYCCPFIHLGCTLKFPYRFGLWLVEGKRRISILFNLYFTKKSFSCFHILVIQFLFYCFFFLQNVFVLVWTNSTLLKLHVLVEVTKKNVIHIGFIYKFSFHVFFFVILFHRKKTNLLWLNEKKTLFLF
jgi:hypothetical protein